MPSVLGMDSATSRPLAVPHGDRRLAVSAAVLLNRLEGVKPTGPGRWIARCPAHEDRSPSLSIRELEDGRVLLHDFGGCDTGAVLASLGLEMAALFPERLPGQNEARGYARTSSWIPARDLLELIDQEALLVATIALEFRERRALSEEDWERLATAAARIGRARDHAHGS